MALDQTTASDRKRARDSENAQRARAGAANAEQETKAVGAVHKGTGAGAYADAPKPEDFAGTAAYAKAMKEWRMRKKSPLGQAVNNMRAKAE